MERQLVTVQKVATVSAIEGADFIELATFENLGWQCVVKKGEVVPGQLVCYMEIDCIVPRDKEWAAFMASRKFRVKTISLKKTLSQGLALPLSTVGITRTVEIGDDLTEELGVIKYEPQIHTNLGNFRPASTRPSFIPKTDEIRIQSALRLLEEIKGLPYYITVKYDGSSLSLAKIDNELFLCSRNHRLKIDEETDNRFWDAIKNDSLQDKLPNGYLIQGELCGPGIQQNRLALSDHRVFVFNVMKYDDAGKPKMLSYKEQMEFCILNQIPHVKIERVGDAFDYTLDQLLELAEGFYDGTKNRREGIVVRPQNPTYSYKLQNLLSFKCISNSYLLKDET